jgi:hypothetical protein
MPGTFQTGCASIDLDGPPFNVTRTVKTYVLRNQDGSFGLFCNEACTKSLMPPDLPVYRGQATGLYFYIPDVAANDGVTFCDGTGADNEPTPVFWRDAADDLCPATVTYGKILADRTAFSMMDYCTSDEDTRHPFDLQVLLPNGHRTTILGGHDAVTEIDPTIVEKGEEPPSGG